ncbi:MAG: hypothetical protein WC458_01080 [Patescibacteria group bacterium]
MFNQVVWVYGPSAVGKETFINYLVKEKPLELLNQLDLGCSSLSVCADSLNWIAKKSDDGNNTKRKHLDRLIENISKNNQNSVVLIKGQDFDFKYGTPIKVKHLLPLDKHRVFYLTTEFEVVYNRFVRKVWWTKDMSKNVCRKWANEQMKYLLDIERNGFEIMVINSSDIGYKILDLNFKEIKY